MDETSWRSGGRREEMILFVRDMAVVNVPQGEIRFSFAGGQW